MGRQAGVRTRTLVIISTMAVLIVLLLASAVQATADGRAGGNAGTADVAEDPAATEYRVRPGDTLWQIAADHGSADRDLRDLVEEIRRRNGLDGALIHPGQVLVIPSH